MKQDLPPLQRTLTDPEAQNKHFMFSEAERAASKEITDRENTTTSQLISDNIATHVKKQWSDIVSPVKKVRKMSISSIVLEPPHLRELFSPHPKGRAK